MIPWWLLVYFHEMISESVEHVFGGSSYLIWIVSEQVLPRWWTGLGQWSRDSWDRVRVYKLMLVRDQVGSVFIVLSHRAGNYCDYLHCWIDFWKDHSVDMVLISNILGFSLTYSFLLFCSLTDHLHGVRRIPIRSTISLWIQVTIRISSCLFILA